MPDLRNLPDMSYLPYAADLPDMSNLRNLSDLSYAADMSNLPHLPDLSHAADLSYLPHLRRNAGRYFRLSDPKWAMRMASQAPRRNDAGGAQHVAKLRHGLL